MKPESTYGRQSELPHSEDGRGEIRATHYPSTRPGGSGGVPSHSPRADHYIDALIARHEKPWPPGERNQRCNAYAYALGTVAHAGVSESEALALVVHAAAAAGLGEREARATFRSGWTAGTMSPVEIYGSAQLRPPRRMPLPSMAQMSVDVPEDAWPLLDAMWSVIREGQPGRAEQWAEPRGITPDALAAEVVTDLTRPMCQRLRDVVRDADLEVAAKIGMWNAEKSRPWYPLMGSMSCCLLPIWHPTHPHPVSYRARVYRPVQGRQKVMAARTRHRWAQWPLGLRGRDLDVMRIAEGEPDWLALRSCGMSAVGTVGSLWLPHWAPLLRGVRRVVIARQHDAASERLTAQIVAAYADIIGSAAAAERITVVVPDEDGQDWDDALASAGTEAVCRLCR